MATPVVTKKEKLEQLNCFTPEEAELIKMRFGIGFPNMSISEIAKIANKDIDLFKKQLRDIEKRLYNMLKI